MSLPNPATIYWCPACGRMDWGKEPNEWHPDAPVIHRRRDKQGNCEGTPLARLLVDPATTREGREVCWEDGSAYVEYNTLPNDTARRVLVFDAPKETTDFPADPDAMFEGPV